MGREDPIEFNKFNFNKKVKFILLGGYLNLMNFKKFSNTFICGFKMNKYGFNKELITLGITA